MSDRAPITSQIAAFVATMAPDRPPPPVRDYARRVVFDGIGGLVAAGHRAVTASSGIGALVEGHGGAGPATLIARGRKADVVSAALANGTLGDAADFEPHHPAAILHAVAVMVPTALAISELRGGTGAEMVAAVVLGCEITYRVSMALDPRELYDLGFHPSAVAGDLRRGSGRGLAARARRGAMRARPWARRASDLGASGLAGRPARGCPALPDGDGRAQRRHGGAAATAGVRRTSVATRPARRGAGR